MTALDLLLSGLRADPARIVVEHRGREVAARDFLGKVHALAAHLREAGLRRGDVLGIAAAGNATAMQLLMASWMCGAAALVLDVRQPARGLADWHRRLDLRFLAGSEAARVPDGPEILPIPAAIAPLEEPPWEPPRDGELVADFMMSSGTTGQPKAMPSTQASLARTIEQRLRDPALGNAGGALSALSLAYPGSRAVWYRSLAGGQKIVALDLLHSLRELDAALMRPDVLECTLPPGLIRRLAQLPPSGPGPRYPQLRRLQAIGGPATPQDKLAAVLRLTPNYLMTYSSTECGVIARIGGLEILDRPASCGRPIEGCRVEIVDGDRTCAPSETGRIRVHREGKDPVEPGDLGWLDEAGYLHIAGRSGGMMCRNGINVGVAEVEEALLACPLVADAVAWPTPDEDGGDRIHAVLECPAEAEAAVRDHIRRGLSNRERPDRIVLVRDLPRGPGGKPDRRAIVAAFAEATAEPADA